MLNNYEIMIIFTPVLSQQDLKKQETNYSNFITKNKGKVVNSTSWGLKTLAYSIQKKITGLYFILEFQLSSNNIEPLKTKLKRDENVLRYMITKLSKFAIEYNAKKMTPSQTEEKVTPKE